MISETTKKYSETYLPIKEASKLVSYSRDYVAKLAREQKINAKQVNRQWVVEVNSLKNFAFLALCEQKIRSQKLSAERKREQQVKKEVEAIVQVTNAKLKKLPTKVRSKLLGTVLAGLCFALLLSNARNMSQLLLSGNLLASLDYAVNQIFSSDALSINKESHFTFPSDPLDKNFDTVIANNSLTADDYQGVIILTASTSAQGIQVTNDLFSDPVEVKMLTETQGKISLSDPKVNGGEVIDFSLVKIPKESLDDNQSYEF